MKKRLLSLEINLGDNQLNSFKSKIWQIVQLAKLQNLGQEEIEKMVETYFGRINISEFEE